MRASNNAKIPIVIDSSSCNEGLSKLLHGYDFQVMDVVDFVVDFVLPLLPKDFPKLKTITVHPTCSSVISGGKDKLLEVASVLADDVFVSDNWGCCGFAGDRGMIVPELTQSATSAQALDIMGSDAQAYVSCNKTCELGMSRATGKNFEHILEVLARSLSS